MAFRRIPVSAARVRIIMRKGRPVGYMNVERALAVWRDRKTGVVGGQDVDAGPTPPPKSKMGGSP
jgi:hypothetical protein